LAGCSEPGIKPKQQLVMESNYRNREFEQFLKENADQHRMFPSENVWKNIHGALHTRRKWYAAGLAALLLLTGTAVTLVMVNSPSGKSPVLSAKLDNEKDKTPTAEQLEQIKESIRPFKGKIATPSLLSDNNAPFKNEDAIAENSDAILTEKSEGWINEVSAANYLLSKIKKEEKNPDQQDLAFTTINDNDFNFEKTAVTDEKTEVPVRKKKKSIH